MTLDQAKIALLHGWLWILVTPAGLTIACILTIAAGFGVARSTRTRTMSWFDWLWLGLMVLPPIAATLITSVFAIDWTEIPPPNRWDLADEVLDGIGHAAVVIPVLALVIRPRLWAIILLFGGAMWLLTSSFVTLGKMAVTGAWL